MSAPEQPTVLTDADLDLHAVNPDPGTVVQALLDQAAAGQPTAIGFPGAVDLDYTPVLPLFGRLFNNVGDPKSDPGGTAHTKALERAVVDWCADLMALPANDRWGYVTAGGTEGNLAALHAAHRCYPDAVVYYSQAAHYSIGKILDIIGAPHELVDVDERGEMDYQHLAALVGWRRHRPAVVVATAGTTMTEAVDDPARIDVVLRAVGVDRRHVHVDAALAGIPLALDGSLTLGEGSGVDSVAVSGHKFFGAPIPCGLVLMRDSIRRPGQHIAYTATVDTTVSGSRCGQAAALLWYAIAAHGREGHRARTAQARGLAAYAVEQLDSIGWPAWRHSRAFTVVLATPPAAVTRKWLLATEGQWSHTICMPGVTRGQVDALITDIRTAIRDGAWVPRQRRPPQTLPRQHARARGS
ncbi:histidine decarboxylase [Micromonospora sp. DR5-3]|uniref:histidine decarboxylase n=1 Tax=unclassified Micromonospora TaxID=2617518 RepID=UPI0011D82B11|nr:MULTISPECIES: histidine decarboxylase [unclassified Micromonospora]MCW3817603.1 histidine decarboxylase [Micromonospora sp. DR5-3]TYC22040.1 histidine decarboxylase [Micromonospora sp. MP36]